MKNCDNLSLVLSLRQVYLAKLVDSQKTKQLEFELFGDKSDANIAQLKHLISKATSTYPRMHSSLKLVVQEITALADSKDRLKVVT